MTDGRMTWSEIKNKYPDQWVGLTDVIRDGADIVSAFVKYTDKSSTELGLMQIRDSNLVSIFTTGNDFMPLGAIGI